MSDVEAHVKADHDAPLAISGARTFGSRAAQPTRPCHAGLGGAEHGTRGGNAAPFPPRVAAVPDHAEPQRRKKR